MLDPKGFRPFSLAVEEGWRAGRLERAGGWRAGKLHRANAPAFQYDNVCVYIYIYFFVYIYIYTYVVYMYMSNKQRIYRETVRLFLHWGDPVLRSVP